MQKTLIALVSITGIALLLCQFESRAAKKTTYLTVAAGSLDRRDAIVAFALPKDLKGKLYALRDESGRALTLQVEGIG